MKQIFSNFFRKKVVKHVSFHTGTSGMQKHKEFLEWVNENDVEFINSFITYHSYSNSHKPESINYVIKYKP